MSSDDAYERFIAHVISGEPMPEDEWLFHFDHQNSDARSGVEVGELAPRFALPDQRGDLRTREGLTGERGLLLVFARSADW